MFVQVENFVPYSKLKWEQVGAVRDIGGMHSVVVVHLTLNLTFCFVHHLSLFISFVHFSVISNYECIDLVSASVRFGVRLRFFGHKCCQT